MSSVTLPAKTIDIQGDAPPKRKFVNAAGGSSPLARSLDEVETAWLMNHLVNRHDALNLNMASWRADMARYERMSEEDYTDRKGADDEVNESCVADIFASQNESLGVVAGFYDFHHAQAKDDIFGTRPWLAATPEGREDADLADTITKHLQWKLNQSNVEQTLIDALKVSAWGGTAFVKAAFLDEREEFEKIAQVAFWTESAPEGMEPGKAVLDPVSGAYVQTAEELAEMGVSAEQIEWRPQSVTETATVYANVTNSLIDFRDIAFETTAPELSLLHTDVFIRFRMGLIDLMNRCGIPMERKSELLGLLGAPNVAKQHRAETEPGLDLTSEAAGNPPVSLVEGFVRCAPKNDGKPVRIHVIFSPEMNALFSVDALANVTPGGILPVFPVRIFKKPNRIFGMGYFEKYEKPNNAIDRQYNLITYRNRYNAHVYTFFNPDALDSGEDEENEITLDPQKPMKLKPDKTADEALAFKNAPDTNGRAEMLLNSMLQMIQMRSGITSAAQGELKGVPSASTATGTKDLQSRGATLLKSPIDEQTADIRAIVEFDALLVYANQDRDETFTWGEGREAELLRIDAKNVLGLKANVALTLTQSQNQRKLESAMAAINIVSQYIALPEIEKPAARFAFVQALSSVGYHNAEDILREAAVDAAGILALVPPEVAPVVQQALEQAGMGVPPEPAGATLPGGNSAPVSAPA